MSPTQMPSETSGGDSTTFVFTSSRCVTPALTPLPQSSRPTLTQKTLDRHRDGALDITAAFSARSPPLGFVPLPSRSKNSSPSSLFPRSTLDSYSSTFGSAPVVFAASTPYQKLQGVSLQRTLGEGETDRADADADEDTEDIISEVDDPSMSSPPTMKSEFNLFSLSTPSSPVTPRSPADTESTTTPYHVSSSPRTAGHRRGLSMQLPLPSPPHQRNLSLAELCIGLRGGHPMGIEIIAPKIPNKDLMKSGRMLYSRNREMTQRNEADGNARTIGWLGSQ